MRQGMDDEDFMFFAICVALGTGALIASLGPINGTLQARTGFWGMSSIVHALGLVTALAGFAVAGQRPVGGLAGTPWFAFTGGLVGLVVIAGTVFSVQRLGVTGASVLLVFAQLATAVLVDSLGLLGQPREQIRWVRLAGVLLVAAGAYLSLRRSEP
jgi:transporter family-2 protein